MSVVEIAYLALAVGFLALVAWALAFPRVLDGGPMGWASAAHVTGRPIRPRYMRRKPRQELARRLAMAVRCGELDQCQAWVNYEETVGCHVLADRDWIDLIHDAAMARIHAQHPKSYPQSRSHEEG